MKYIPILLLLSATALRAQVPHIDYMMADEAKSQLQIHGIFTSDTTGFVTIENTKQTVRFWSDSLVISDLPDSGAGSGGHVMVSQMSGVSNSRMLSIFEATIVNPFYFLQAFSGGLIKFIPVGQAEWDFNWRIDIAPRPNNVSTQVQFEISKSSIGEWSLQRGGPPSYLHLNRSDSSHFSNKALTLFGELDLRNFKVKFSPTRMQSLPWSQDQDTIPYIEFYQPNSLDFDTTGYLSGYHNNDTTGAYSQEWEKHTDYLSNQKILFPPSPKNAVSQSAQPTSNLIKIFSHIGSEDHQISFEAEAPLGETMASLYSIDGRLLKQEKIFISSAGMYSFDASGINTRVGFLVLKTEKGIVAGKVLF